MNSLFEKIEKKFGKDNCLIEPSKTKLKFNAVFGTVSPKRPNTILPTFSPPIEISKNVFIVIFWSSHDIIKKHNDIKVRNLVFDIFF